jgi:hypothetical protein
MPLTWSISRENTLETCERRYFLSYVVQPRMNSRIERLREIAVLKKLKTISMWRGEVFHELAAKYLRRAQFSMPNAPQLLATAVDQMRKDWDASAAKHYRKPPRRHGRGTEPGLELELGLDIGANQQPGLENDGGPASLALFEHEYDLTSGGQLLSDAIAAVELWFDRLVAWAIAECLVDQLRSARRSWIEPKVFGAGAPGFASGPVQVVTKVDLAFERRDGRFMIYDWKTGAPRPTAPGVIDDDAEYQVTMYQLWPHLRLGIPTESIVAHVVYLGADPVLVRSYGLDPDTRERVVRRINRSVRRGLALHGVGNHAPLKEADFDFAGHPAMCRWCGFKRICQGATSV